MTTDFVTMRAAAQAAYDESSRLAQQNGIAAPTLPEQLQADINAQVALQSKVDALQSKVDSLSAQLKAANDKLAAALADLPALDAAEAKVKTDLGG